MCLEEENKIEPIEDEIMKRFLDTVLLEREQPILDVAAEHPAILEAAPPVILSFDVEEHHRIEAASGLHVSDALKAHYAERAADSTRWLLDLLDRHQVRATFFIVGELARNDPELVRDVHQAGHEVASHGWSHRRVLEMTPDEFRHDLRQSKDVLEQITGEAVVGYRAPTFSIVRRTFWALDVLAEEGFLYDSSIYPVRHDRYGVPDAPRGPFLARGRHHAILEIPPATLRVGPLNLPAGGGGYFRLFPLGVIQSAIAQTGRLDPSAATMLYFHPWEFDPEQSRLPLHRASRFRTYVGISRSRDRLGILLARYRVARAIDAARRLELRRTELTVFDPASVGGMAASACPSAGTETLCMS